MNVITIKLITGEEIIGRLEEDNETTTVLSKPVVLGITQKGIGFAPLFFSIDDTLSITFKKQHILFQASTRKELVDAYLQSTTGIALT